PRRPTGDLLLGAGLLIWLVAVVLWITWSPYQFLTPANPLREFAGNRNAIQLIPDPSAGDLLGNSLLLVPIAVALALTVRHRPILKATFAALLFSITIELGQMFLPDRMVSVADVVLNSSGAMVGAVVARRLAARLGSARLLWGMM